MELSEKQVENITLLFDSIFYMQKLADKYISLDENGKRIAQNILPKKDLVFINPDTAIMSIEFDIISLYVQYTNSDPIHGIDFKDVKLVMLQTRKSFRECYQELVKEKGDIINAIMKIMKI